MAARSVGNATISFGLVSVPVKLYTATQSSSGVSFNMLHAKCGTRLRQQYICPKDNEVVDRADTVKGYEVAKDQYVTFTPAELKALEEQSTEAIEISEFVPAEQVDPVYYDRAYYLAPDHGADKAYRLLSQVMRKSDKVALARYAARGKQYLVMLRPGPAHPDGKDGGDSLVMQQLLYADEVRPISEVPSAEGGAVKENELAMAEQLVDKISHEEFHPEEYHDDVKDRVLKLIEEKSHGHTIETSGAPAPRAQVIDLMEALKQSLALSEGKPKAEVAGRKPPKRSSGSSGGSEKVQEKKKARK